MIKNLVLAAAAAVVAVIAIAAWRPDTYHLVRSIQIERTPEAIYPLIADLRRHVEWSPWEQRDPDIRRGYSGSASGVGAVYAWNGNDEVGQGRMEVIEAQPPTRLRILLDVLRPVQSRNTSLFDLVPEADGTRLTWTMEGPNPFLSRLMQVFVSLDRLVGSEVDLSLSRLKQAAEREVVNPDAGTQAEGPELPEAPEPPEAAEEARPPD